MITCSVLPCEAITPLAHAAWALLALRALWRLPDWIAKWRLVLEADVTSERRSDLQARD